MKPSNKNRSRFISLITVSALAFLVTACGGGGGGGNSYTVTASAGSNGTISPSSVTVNEGSTTSFTVTPAMGYGIDTVDGCGGTLSGNTYTTGAITADCAVIASFSINTYTVTASAGTNGNISPGSATVNYGSATNFTVTPDAGYGIDSVTGCGGSLVGNTYTTGAIIADCVVDATFALPVVSLSNATVIEGNSGTKTLTLTASLTAHANGDVTVDYATSDDTATNGSDYAAASGTLTISNGTTSNTINVSILGDTLYEYNETLTVTLSNVSVNATLGTATATGTIANDDPGGLNDTGITTCSDDTTNGLACPQATHPGQDAEYGRDANPVTNNNADGHAGFSFTKLDATGTPLADQSADYATTPWACVLDNVTGLIWEVKTDDGGLHDKDWTYSWYSSDTASNGGNAGTTNGGVCADYTNCDTEKFSAIVNAGLLCGYDDWRIPTTSELVSIVDGADSVSRPALDVEYFPNALGTLFWTSLTNGLDIDSAWYVDFNYGSASNGRFKSSAYPVRLVRSCPYGTTYLPDGPLGAACY